MPSATGKELGDEGLSVFAGRVTEAYIDELRWPGCYDTINEMRRRDPTLRAILNAIKMLARQADVKAEAPTDKAPDREAAEFLDTCLEDMSHTVGDFIDDALTMLPFGWSSFEICYKRREGDRGAYKSKLEDGKIGWRKFAYRRQSTLHEWQFDEDGGLAGWYQMTPPTYKATLLPIKKLLHFVAERDGSNPEGISLFESAYEPWHFVTNLQIIGGMGWQRSFVGLPTFQFKETMSDDDKAAAQTMGQALVVNEKQYIIAPPSCEFSLQSTQNPAAGELLRYIQYYRVLMCQLVLADFIFLGTGGNVGSWALGSDKSLLFLMAVNGILERIASTWSRYGVERLFQYNEFPGITELPRVTFSQIRKPNLPELGEFLQRISPLITLGDEDELWLREQSGMPEIDLKVLQQRRQEKEARAEQIRQQIAQQTPEPETEQAKPETGEQEQQAEGDMAEFADPELTEEEIARRRVERRFARDVRGFLGDQQERVVDELTWAEYQWDRLPSDFWPNEREAFKKAVLSDLTKDIQFLLTQSAGLIEGSTGAAVDWTLANAPASRWARTHTGDLIKSVTDTTKEQVRESVRNWIETGDDLPTLVKRLESTFGPVRAEMIASTEVTNAYAEANDLVGQAAGLPPLAFKPAAHVRCRCWERPELLPSGEWVWVWQTATDELVCTTPIMAPWGMVTGCQDLQGRIISEGDKLGMYLNEVQ